MDGLEQYARLIAMGQPDFIEIKAVTFCGSSAATDLSHSNVPFHSEVLEFSTKLMSTCGFLRGDDKAYIAFFFASSIDATSVCIDLCGVCVNHHRFGQQASRINNVFHQLCR